jgi:uncharacterized cupredoxin-like copper-binding protein
VRGLAGQRPTRRARAAVGLATMLVVAGAATLVDVVTTPSPAEALGPGEVTVTLDVEHSRFEPDRLRVRAGTLVRFVVRNHDPIHHELVVGPPEVHDAHERGTEAVHPPVPGEVSVGPHETRATFYRFDEPGTVDFACHLPGHVGHGMVGEVEVVR